MKVPLLLAASAILSLASTATLAADTSTPPPAANAKTTPPVAPPRPYTEDDCLDMNAQLDDSIESSNLDAKIAEKIRQQRTGADQSCNSGDYAAGARQLRRILDEVIEARSRPAADAKTPPPVAETKPPSPAAETKTPPPATDTETPPPATVTETPPPAAGTESPPPAADAKTAPPADNTKTPPPVAPPRPYTEDDCREMNGQIDDSIKSSNLDAALVEKISRQRTGADQSCKTGDYAAGARQLRRILDEVIEARSRPAADAKPPPPAAETKTPSPAADTETPPPAADTKTPPPVAPPRPYTEDDCQEMNGQIDDSIESSKLDAALAEKIRRQRTGADQSCKSGDYAAGARQLRRILDEVIEARSKAGG